MRLAADRQVGRQLVATGVKESGCFLAGVPDVAAGQWYFVRFDVKGETDPRCGIQWQNKGAYDWNIPARYPVFKPLSDGWRRGVIVVRVPHGVDKMMLHLSPRNKASDEQTLFRNVAIHRIDD